jgi:hypothetical protein
MEEPKTVTLKIVTRSNMSSDKREATTAIAFKVARMFASANGLEITVRRHQAHHRRHQRPRIRPHRPGVDRRKNPERESRHHRARHGRRVHHARQRHRGHRDWQSMQVKTKIKAKAFVKAKTIESSYRGLSKRIFV